MATLEQVYHDFVGETGYFLDRIASDPAVRTPFLARVVEATGQNDEAEILGHLFSLRKRGNLSRKRPR